MPTNKFTILPEDAEKLATWLISGLAVVLENSEATDKEIRKYRSHDVVSSIAKALYSHRSVFIAETRQLFRRGPKVYLASKKKELAEQ